MVLEIDGKQHIVPRWDTEENQNEINIIRKTFLKKCSCTKGCHNKKCSCVKVESVCSNLCTCIGCANTVEKMEIENDVTPLVGEEGGDTVAAENYEMNIMCEDRNSEDDEEDEDEEEESDYDDETEFESAEESEDDNSDRYQSGNEEFDDNFSLV